MAYKAQTQKFQVDTPMKTAAIAFMVPLLVNLVAVPAHCGALETLTYSCPPEHNHQPHTHDEATSSSSASTAPLILGPYFPMK